MYECRYRDENNFRYGLVHFEQRYAIGMINILRFLNETKCSSRTAGMT